VVTPDLLRQPHQHPPQPEGATPRRRSEPVAMIAAADLGRLDSQSK
jgi:hypothetical protein